MSPKLIDKTQRKTEIALVALDLFAEHGFEATSISQVAQAAGIGKGTIYEYFESKDDLIVSSIQAWFDTMGQDSDEIFAIENAEERLRRYVHVMMQGFVTDDRTAKLMIGMFQLMLKGQVFTAQNTQFQALFRFYRKAFVDMLLDGVSQGIFRPEIARDAEKIAANLFAYLDGIGFHSVFNKDDIDLMEYVDFYLEQLLRMLKKSSNDTNTPNIELEEHHA